MPDATLRALSGWDYLVLVVIFSFMAGLAWVGMSTRFFPIENRIRRAQKDTDHE